MIEISVKSDAAAALRRLRDLPERQIPFATAVALTRTAKAVEERLKAEIRTRFDRPTPWTQRSVFTQPATKTNLRAIVWFKDRLASGTRRTASEILGHHFTGGSRTNKGLEQWLARAGFISQGEFVAPGEAARLDRYGNMSRGQVQQILSQLRAGPDTQQYASKSKRSQRNQQRAGRMFWSRGGRLPRGVWIRRGRELDPILVVVRSPSYSQRLDLKRLGDQVTRERFTLELNAAIERARATAR